MTHVPSRNEHWPPRRQIPDCLQSAADPTTHALPRFVHSAYSRQRALLQELPAGTTHRPSLATHQPDCAQTDAFLQSSSEVAVQLPSVPVQRPNALHSASLARHICLPAVEDALAAAPLPAWGGLLQPSEAAMASASTARYPTTPSVPRGIC